MRPSHRPPWPKQTCFLAWLPRAPPHRVPRRIATTSAQKAAPVDLPKLVITAGSKHHNSLPTYIEYAKRTGLSTDRTVYVGTHYEYTSALALMRLGFSLLRTGKAYDAGIDLIGHWVLGPLREPMPVFMQCKARTISASPSHIRELEGSFLGTPRDWKNKDVLGLLVTTKKATKGVMKAMGQSRLPIGFVMISRDGTVQQFVWNRAASERGLEGVGVTVRHTPRALLLEPEEEDAEEGSTKPLKKRLGKFKNTGTRKDIQLTWMGSPIFPNREDLDQETVKLMRSIIPSNDDASATTLAKQRMGRSKTSGKRGLPPTTLTVPVKAARSVGRPKGSLVNYLAKVPSPRGGQIPRASVLSKIQNCGRLKGSKNPPGSKKTGKPAAKKPIPELPPLPEGTRRRGRPRGSKNKPKIDVDAG